MKKFNLFISLILTFAIMILGLALTVSSNDSFISLGGSLFLLSIGLLIFFAFKNNLSIRVSLRKINLKAIPYIIIISIANFLSVICIVCIAYFLKVGNFSEINDTPNLNIITIVGAVIIAPISEELIFRAEFLGILLKKIPVHIAIVIQGFVFASVHCFSFNLASVKFYTVIIGGISFGYIFYYTKSILSSMLCHSFYNSIAVLTVKLTFTTKNTAIFIFSIFLAITSLVLIIYLIRKVKYTCSCR
ncbi:CPBP family intramembrane glutamic endopeptidase [Clostridium neuense]|uniref:CPBP family intramembrane glutamic endopeptidase n=1 Tax=Clostridium neuense TaxID=1728934 RepID=A0ABW8TMC4_9CLOT